MQNNNAELEFNSIHQEECLFAQASQLNEADRETFLDEACGDSPSLLKRMKTLLSIDQKRDKLLDQIYLDCDQSICRIESGDVIGPFQLLKCIGEGGMGRVFLAQQDKPFHRKVALKIIRAGDSTDEMISRFDLERTSLSLFDHPNLTKILDAGLTQSGAPYFAMELVPGKTITRYCDENRLPIADRLKLFADVCSGIQHAHQKGVIHRDLKPSNVMVMEKEEKSIPKIIDFGIAKALGENPNSNHTQTTKLGHLVGTLEYMSPEQIQCDNGGLDARSDIYSLGVLLYELVTGKVPLNRKSQRPGHILDTLEAIKNTSPQKPSHCVLGAQPEIGKIIAENRSIQTKSLGKLLTGDLDRIILKALHKDPEQRFESAAAFRNDVLAFLNGDPVSAVMPTLTYRWRKYFLKHQTLCLLGLSVLLAMIIGTVFSVSQSIRATRAEKKSAKLVIQLQEKNRKLQKAIASAKIGWEIRAINNRNKSIEDSIRRATGRAFLNHVNAEIHGLVDFEFQSPQNVSPDAFPFSSFINCEEIGPATYAVSTSPWPPQEIEYESESPETPFASEFVDSAQILPGEMPSHLSLQMFFPSLKALLPSDDPDQFRIPKFDTRFLELEALGIQPDELRFTHQKQLGDFLKCLSDEQRLMLPENSPVLAETACTRGQLDFFSKKYGNAQAHFEESMAINKSHGLEKRQAFDQLWLARCYQKLDQPVRAQSHLSEAQSVFERSRGCKPHAKCDRLLEDLLMLVFRELK